MLAVVETRVKGLMQNDRDVLELSLLCMLFSLLFSVLQLNISSLPNDPLSINRLAFIHEPAVFTASKLLREPDVWKFGLASELINCSIFITLRTGDADLCFYITTVQDG